MGYVTFAVLAALGLILLLGLIGAIASIFMGKEEGPVRYGKIVSKQEHPAITSVMPVIVGKQTMMIPRHLPARYELTVEAVYHETVSVSAEEFENAEIGKTYKP